MHRSTITLKVQKEFAPKGTSIYLRAIHAETDIPSLQEFINDNPLGIFTTAIESPSFPFLQSSHVPFVLDVPPGSSSNPPETGHLGTLRGHLARAHPQAKALLQHLETRPDPTDPSSHARINPQTLTRDVMVLFTSPAHHYVTPKFYRETKPKTGKVVPTWNYTAVQVYGRATIYHDLHSPATSAFLDAQMRDLTRRAEVGIMGYERDAWEVEDAPVGYVEALKKGVLGVEIKIMEMGGKSKMSQEMGVGDQKGVVEGFEGLGTEVGRVMAKTVAEKGKSRRE